MTTLPPSVTNAAESQQTGRALFFEAPSFQLVWSLAAVKLAIHLVWMNSYGFFRDELYYLACTQHLDWGYVDQPPLIAIIAWLARNVLGESLFAIRLPAALAGAAKVVLTGYLVREFGGGRMAQALACTAVIVAPIYLGIDNFLSMNAFEPLFWVGCAYVLTLIINRGEPRYWIWFGILAGLGLENKHSMVFFGAALIAGLLLSPMRRLLWSRWFWIGGMIAFLIALPNLIWQIRHDWATYELLQNVSRSTKNVVLAPTEFLKQQVLIMHPLSVVLWGAGLAWLLFLRAASRWRVFGWTYLLTLFTFIILKGKNYYLAPIYPILFAGGAVALTEGSTHLNWRWIPASYLVLLAITGAVLAPVSLPILRPERYAGYAAAVGIQPPRTERSHTGILPQHLGDQFGWEEMVAAVARVYNSLPAEERNKAGIFVQNYGEAGAIDFFGRKYGLPPALSGHQNYFLWGPRGYTGEVMIVMDDSPGLLPKICASLQDAGPISVSPFAMPDEQRQRLYICRDTKPSLQELWPKVKNWL